MTIFVFAVLVTVNMMPANNAMTKQIPAEHWRRIQERAAAMNYGRIEIVIQAGQITLVEVRQTMKLDAPSLEQDGVIQL